MKLLDAFRSVRGRIQYGTLSLSLLPMLLVGLAIGAIAFLLARNALQARALEQVTSLRTVKAEQVIDYFDDLKNGVTLLAQAHTIRTQVPRLIEAIGTVGTTGAGIAAVAPDIARERMQRYYLGEFHQEYARRNGGAQIDVKPILEQLTDTAYALQYHYIANNPNPAGAKGEFAGSKNGSAYDNAHLELHSRVGDFIRSHGYYDVFLVDPATGVIAYSYAKEIDFGTSLLNGPFAKSRLGDAFRAIRDNPRADAFHIADYGADYVPSYLDPNGFVATAVNDGDRRIAIAIAQTSTDRLNNIMTFHRNWQRSGLGTTGEILLVGTDTVVRSLPRTLLEDKANYLVRQRAEGLTDEQLKRIDAKDNSIGVERVESPAVGEAAAGKTGAAPYVSHRGVRVLGAYAPLEPFGLKWTIIARVDEAEAFAPVTVLLRNLLVIGVALLALALVASWFFSTRLARSVNAPIDRLQGTVQRLSDGELDARTGLVSNDELGQLGKALDGLLDDRVNALAAAARENEQLNHSVIEIMQAVSRLSSRDLTVKVPVTQDVTGAISDALNLMTSQTANVLANVDDISGKVASASNRVRERAESAMAVAAEGSREIDAASKELSEAAGALKDIAERAGQADRAADEAIRSTREALSIVRDTVGGIGASRDLIRETEKRIKRLGERSQEISATVNLIGNIAERTSLLALNTSMQAVAAGETGRAYAVVADEVKRLAEGARGATQQISNLVGAIQSETVDTVEAINRAISQVVEISRLAERAGDQMRSTEEKTELLVNSVRSIAQTTEAQSRASDALQARALQIRNATRETTEQLADQADQTRNLSDYAAHLVESVRVFTLPR
ncbi:MAG TPA: HAMP domain-containing methyl-accepting chemotaxis protein [Tahibacter sp.]|nr:HAMP domain-containing methyl-accepting chemotaxis protein [Tahibacter sp.]